MIASALDLPSPRREGWRWFAGDALAAAAALPAAAEEADGADEADEAEPCFAAIEGPRLLFVDGRLVAGASRLGPLEIVRIAAATDHPLGARAGGTGWRLALARDAVAAPIQIVHRATGAESHLPAEILLDDDAVASVHETYVGRGWANRLTRIRLGRAARLMRSVRLLHADGFVSLREEAELGAGASYVASFLGATPRGSRIDVRATLAGEGAYAEVGGALLARAGDAHEAAVVVRHAAPNGSSRQFWRMVAADRGIASAAARVEVARGAQATDGEQSLRGLLLDRSATINLKPELEIFADDVKCAHGATVGELDRDALFYLESRGLAPPTARALMTRAFIDDALARIADETIRAGFAEAVDQWLAAAR